MKVICKCGKEMTLNLYEPDQDETLVGFDCDCGASLYGTMKNPDKKEEHND